MDILNMTQTFEKAMDVASLRQQVIANNIANVNTPGYAPSKVNFEDEMKRCMASAKNDGFQVVCDFSDPDLGVVGSAGSISEVQASVIQSGKQVDVNQEMVDLAKNSIIFDALSSQVTGRYSNLKYVIENYGR